MYSRAKIYHSETEVVTGMYLPQRYNYLYSIVFTSSCTITCKGPFPCTISPKSTMVIQNQTGYHTTWSDKTMRKNGYNRLGGVPNLGSGNFLYIMRLN